MKTELTVLDKVKKAVGIELEKAQMNLATETLDEGQVTIEAEVFAEGEAVMIVNGEDRIPLPVGEYNLDNGMILKVEEEGVIASISEMAEEQPEQEEEVAASDSKTETPLPKAVIESIVKETKFSKEDVELLLAKLTEVSEVKETPEDKDAKIAKLEAEITELKKAKETEGQEEEESEVVELAAKPVTHNPEENAKKEPVKLSRKKGQTTSQRTMSNITSVLNRK